MCLQIFLCEDYLVNILKRYLCAGILHTAKAIVIALANFTELQHCVVYSL